MAAKKRGGKQPSIFTTEQSSEIKKISGLPTSKERNEKLVKFAEKSGIDYRQCYKKCMNFRYTAKQVPKGGKTTLSPGQKSAQTKRLKLNQSPSLKVSETQIRFPIEHMGIEMDKHGDIELVLNIKRAKRG